jgi:hypothetical protein
MCVDYSTDYCSSSSSRLQLGNHILPTRHDFTPRQARLEFSHSFSAHDEGNRPTIACMRCLEAHLGVGTDMSGDG